MIRYSYVYLLTNKYNSVIYAGVTTGLIKRVYQHKNKLTPGFSSRYNIGKLVYYEVDEVWVEYGRQLRTENWIMPRLQEEKHGFF